MDEAYDSREQDQLIEMFTKMLRGTTKDGGKKRAAGEKEPWWRDPEHMAAVWSHFRRRAQGEMADPDSGQHPFVHAAWRLLAEAYQETYGRNDPVTLGLVAAYPSRDVRATSSVGAGFPEEVVEILERAQRDATLPHVDWARTRYGPVPVVIDDVYSETIVSPYYHCGCSACQTPERRAARQVRKGSGYSPDEERDFCS